MEVDAEEEESTERGVQTAEGERETVDKIVKYELIEAASKGDLSVFKKYEAHKDNPHIADYDKRTPLHLAAVENKMEVVKYLIEEWKVDAAATDRWGKTAYDEAARANNFEVADYLKAAQRTTRMKLDAQQYEIINAASEGNLSQLKRCHQEGLNMDFGDYDKRTPLHLAAAEGHTDVVEFLINDCKVDAEVKDRWGNTPRDEAERFNHRQLAYQIQTLNAEQIYKRNNNIQESDKHDYERTLMKETTRSHCIRINIVGHSLAGKTSLAKRLLEQEFESTTKPTNSIDTHVYEVYATEEGGWKMVKEAHVYNECYSKTIAFSEQKDTALNDVDRTKEKQREKPLLKRHVEDIENFRLKKQARIDKESVPTFINIWDFGGQAVFHATHQMFYSPDSIYLLVIDLSESVGASLPNTEFHKDVQDNLNLKTIEELCIYWINTIFAYTGTQKRKPPIFLVGTHKDKMNCPSDDDKDEKANEMFARIRKHFGEVIQDEIQSQTFFIDNTVSSDNETENLKRAILKYARENTEFEREIPKRWIPLESSLRQIKERNYATFEEIWAVNEQNLVPIDTAEDLNDFLAYQHRQGSIVYFQDLKLSNHVILNPQWLIDAFKSVITEKKFFRGTEDDCVMLFENAKIRSEVFEDIWRKDNTFYKRKDMLLDFLKQFGVIARPKVEIGDNIVKDEDFYYVPSLLTKTGDADIEKVLLSNPEKSIMAESIPLQFIIKTPILPPSQYNSIVSAIIAKWPILQHHGESQFFVNRCIVKLLDEKRGNTSNNVDTKPVINHYGSISMPSIPGNVIEIKVYGIASYLSSEERTIAEKVGSFVISSRKCDQFRRFVEKALRGCLERFLVDSSDKYEVCMREKDLETNKMCTISIKHLMQNWFADSVESIEDRQWSKRINEKELSKVTSALGRNWEILCLSLGVHQTQMDRINESREPVAVRMFRALNEWRKQNEDKATWEALKTELKRNPSVTYDMDVLKTIMEES